MNMQRELVRVIRFRPYRRGCGPVFRLKLWDTNQRRGGHWILAYRLSIGAGELNTAGNPASWRVIFDGADFGASPLHAVDSDATVASLMTFLTLRPGDTDREYFADYTPAQLAFASEHAEALGNYVADKLGR